MNEQPQTPQMQLQTVAEQNQKMRKKLLIAIAATVGVVALLIATLLIIKACQKEEEAFSLPDSYFYPTYPEDIFEYADYMDKRPDVILYCEDPDGLGRTTSIDAGREDEFSPEVLYLRDFLHPPLHLVR